MTSALNGITTVFIDDGGVLNDNRLRGPQWARLSGEYLAPRLGATPEGWAAANPVVFTRLWNGDFGPAASTKFASYREWSAAYYEAWLTGMCEAVSVLLPPAPRVTRIARDADDYITRRVFAAFPGATDAVRKLRGHGLTLHLGSGGDSRGLANYMEGMSIRDCFDTLYGADLVDTLKDRPEFHRRVFEDAGIDAERALVIEDSPSSLTWASNLGAKTALIAEQPHPRFTFTAPSLAALVEQLLQQG